MKKTDPFEDIVLHGFPLKGCWKEIVSDLRKWKRPQPAIGRGFLKASTLRPEAWEFTNYNEKYARQMYLKHKKRK